jgi:prepilin peptidase CpaA
MSAQGFIIALHAILAGSLILAAITDLRSRIIENWLTGGLALLAPVLWWSMGVSIWPDLAIHIAIAFGIFALFTLMFALGVMGGGDVKLIGALALWMPLLPMVRVLVLMSIFGGALTIVYWVRHKATKSLTNLEIPYGVAIAIAGLWVLYERYLNHFG